MLKRSTLLSVSICFLLVLGLSDYGYGCHRPGSNDQKGCDDSGTGIPVVVTFDDRAADSLQSDGVPGETPGLYPDGSYINEEGVGAIIPVEGSPPGQFHMNTQNGGGRNLLIDFGLAGSCNDDDTTDCVEDDRFVDVECPFPAGLNVRTTEGSCSAFVKAALGERTAFFGDAPGEEYILNMDPGNPCPGNPCGGEVKLVRPAGDVDIGFRVPRPKGNKLDSWLITFSDQDGICSGQTPPVGRSLPDFLSIRALDMDNLVGGENGADTWHIGTFVEDLSDPAGGINDSRLACLFKDKGDEFVGFFIMSFMYTVVIKE